MNVRALPAPRSSMAAVAVVAGLVLAQFILYVGVSAPFDSDWRGVDMEAYWMAGLRLREGGALYAPMDVQVYTYAPWFAYLWVPLTLLPHALVEAVWLALLLASVAWLAYPLFRSVAGTLLGLLIVPQMVEYAWIGNVDALMLVALALLRTRAGPVLVGIAASLKITPIAFVAYYVVRREWSRAAVAVGMAAVLWAPALLFDLSKFGAPLHAVDPDIYSLSALGVLPWLASNAVILGGLALLALRDHRFVLLAAAVAAMLGNPRMTMYAVGYLVIPSRPERVVGRDLGAR